METTLSVDPFRFVYEGKRTVYAEYRDSEGKPIRGAMLTVTGDTASLPATMKEQREPGRYSVHLRFPSDMDGMRDTMFVRVHKPGFVSKSASVSYFIADETWVTMPDHVERCLLDWQSEYPQFITLAHVLSYSGYKNYGVTLTDTNLASSDKVKVMFLQSHGHEPAGTAAMMDVIHQLLKGRTQEGDPTGLDREALLKEMILVFIPIGNPGGRERSPAQFFCDQFDDETLLSYCEGRLAGETTAWKDRIKHQGLLHASQHNFDLAFPIGLRWEQVGEDDFIDPWCARHPASYVETSEYEEICRNIEKERVYRTSLWRMLRTMLDRHDFRVAIDLHQMIPAPRHKDAGQIWIREKEVTGSYAYDIAKKIERDWKARGIAVRPRYLMKEYYMNPTDLIHLYSPGRPASFITEVNAGRGTTKKMQKEIHVSTVISVIRFAHEKAP